MEKRIELGKEIFTGFNENSFSDCEWKLIGNCTGTQENYLLRISTLGFTFVTMIEGKLMTKKIKMATISACFLSPHE